MITKKYTEIFIGDKEELRHKITQADIEKFVNLTGDDNKLHIDPVFAGTTQFKKPVVHGMLGASFISTVIGTKLPGDGALWFSQTLEFLLPVRIGDEILVVAEVIKKNDKENIIELKTDIFNQNRQIVTKGIAKVKVIEQIVEEVKKEEVEKTKTALIIGATGGIGEAVCAQLAEDGFNLIIHYHSNEQKARGILEKTLRKGIKGSIIKANILETGSIKILVEKAVRSHGNIDVLVNCAASTIPSIKFKDLIWEDYSKQIELNVKANFLLMKEIVPLMIENEYGKIITIGSLAAEKPNGDWSHYITAKSALIGFTRSMAFDLAPKGIRVNMVTPSLVSTELTADIPEKMKLLTAAQTPLRRLAVANDVANAISFLASAKSDFITGEIIRINGGQVML